MTDTIFALSTGLPPAGIAVVRISGPEAGAALAALSGKLPPPRHASYCRFRDSGGAVLDEGLALWFPGPASATGEDSAELHLHGGRAVVAAILAELCRIDGLRPALAGEFTRRAFENGRIDLAQAEGLSDLLAAETESQRAAAMLLAEGTLGHMVAGWQAQLLRVSAQVETGLDFSDEVEPDEIITDNEVSGLCREIDTLLANPPAERLRDGVRTVIAGPANAGKSSLFNALVGRDAAIVTEIAGTTRDRIEAPIALDGVPLLLIDTAGLRAVPTDRVEAIGIERTTAALEEADIVLWLGKAIESPNGAILIAPKADLGTTSQGLPISTVTGEGMAELRDRIVSAAKARLPRPDSLALNARHRTILAEVLRELEQAGVATDGLIYAEHLRRARKALDALTGRAGVEDMLDALFGTFCIGK